MTDSEPQTNGRCGEDVVTSRRHASVVRRRLSGPLFKHSRKFGHCFSRTARFFLPRSPFTEEHSSEVSQNLPCAGLGSDLLPHIRGCMSSRHRIFRFRTQQSWSACGASAEKVSAGCGAAGYMFGSSHLCQTPKNP